MAPKDYYQLLEVAPTAPADEVKRAFRLQIARYHPDKVQHLGQEFQSMAMERATELTEAYRVLSDAGRRAEYDRAVAAAAGATVPPPAAAPPSSSQDGPPPPGPAARPPDAGAPVAHQFKQERASRDEFVRRATVTRFRQALTMTGAGYQEAHVRGFDLSFTPKPKMFGRNKGPRLLGQFVAAVDPKSVAQIWAEVGRLKLPAGEDVCVFLMGTAMAPSRDLAGAIAEQRRRPAQGAKVILIPVDARNWDAHVPLDAPPVVKELLKQLKTSG